MWGAFQTIADQTIHDQLRAVYLGESVSPGHRDVHALYNLQLVRWDRSKAHGGMGHNDLHQSAPGVESAGAHQRSTTIATRSSQDHHMFASGIAIEKAHSGEMPHVTPGVFHPLDHLDAQF